MDKYGYVMISYLWKNIDVPDVPSIWSFGDVVKVSGTGFRPSSTMIEFHQDDRDHPQFPFILSSRRILTYGFFLKLGLPGIHF